MVLCLLAPSLPFQHTSRSLLDILLAVVVCSAYCYWIDAYSLASNLSAEAKQANALEHRCACKSPDVAGMRPPMDGVGWAPRVERDLSDPIIVDVGVLH